MTDKGLSKLRKTDIDAHLRRAFQELTEEALPDRFSSLLDQLRNAETVPKNSDAARDNESETGSNDGGRSE